MKANLNTIEIAPAKDGLDVLLPHLPRYRAELTNLGIAKDDVEWVVLLVWTGAATSMVRSLEDYGRARAKYFEIARTVVSGDWRSEAAVRMLTLSGEIMRFEQEYEGVHGSLPKIA